MVRWPRTASLLIEKKKILSHHRDNNFRKKTKGISGNNEKLGGMAHGPGRQSSETQVPADSTAAFLEMQ